MLEDTPIKLSEGAKIPTKGTEYAAGNDLYSNEDVLLRAGELAKISTGISVSIPDGCFGLVAPRSGLASKGIDVFGGVIDSDYIGEIKVMLKNTSKETIELNSGSRIAQLIILPYIKPNFIQVDSLEETDRGSKGFGSTGK